MFKGSTVSVFFRILSALSSYLFAFVIARLYGSVGFGIFSTSWTILMICSVIGKLGFDTSIIRFMAESISVHGFKNMRLIYKKALIMVLISSAVVSIIVLLFSNFITKKFYDTLDTNTVVLLVALSIIPYALMSFNAETMKGLKKIVPFSLHNNVLIYFGMIVITYIMHGFRPNNINAIISLFIMVFILMISSFLTLRYLQKHYPNKNSFYTELTPGRKKILQITLPMLLTNSIFLMINWTDVLMLSYFTNESTVGIYNTSLKIAALNSLLLIAMNSIAMSKYAELYKSNKITFKKVVKSVSTVSFFFTLPIFILILIFPSQILLFFGEEYTVASFILILLSCGQLFASFSGSTVNLLNMIGKERITLMIIIITFIVNLVMNYFLIPIYGMLGAAISTTFSLFLNNIVSAVFIKSILGFWPYPTFQLKSVLKQIKSLKGKE